jgi:hypothetical protein
MPVNKQIIQEINVSRADSLSTDILDSSHPIILRGIAKQWPVVVAAKKSAEHVLDYLRQFNTDEPLIVFRGDSKDDGRVFYNSDITGFNFEVESMPLSQLFMQLKKSLDQPESPMLYVGSTMIDKWLPGFRVENDLVFEKYQSLASIWMGNKSRIAAHYDFASNVACCVAGRRRFTLFPPEQLENLYVGPLDFTPAGQPISFVDFKQPDFEKFPKFRIALESAIEVELEPGDALLIPSMWWHHVEALESFNVLVNYWWRSSPRYLGSPLNVLQHAVMGLRDLPPEQRAIWQNLFEYYVFEPKDENFEHIPKHARGVLDEISEHKASDIRNLLISRLKR